VTISPVGSIAGIVNPLDEVLGSWPWPNLAFVAQSGSDEFAVNHD
jgi:hypothetical protein